MSKRKLSCCVFAAPAVLLATAVHANPVVVDSFNNSSSFVQEPGPAPHTANFPAYGSYGLDNTTGGPTVPYVRLDETNNPADQTWQPSFSSVDANNNPSSGSLLTTFNFTANGSDQMHWTFDINQTAVKYTDLSFDIMVGTGSAVDSYGGVGYFQVVGRDANYDFNNLNYSEELGNPTYSSPTIGTWEHIDIPLTTPATENLRGLTFTLYNGSRDISGPESIYMDNIVLQNTLVPEPASLGLLALAGSSMLMRRRRRA